MATAYLLIVFVGTLITVVGIIGLGLGTKSRDEQRLERQLAAHRRRTLLGMLQSRSSGLH
jgi:hypothetical protein